MSPERKSTARFATAIAVLLAMAGGHGQFATRAAAQDTGLMLEKVTYGSIVNDGGSSQGCAWGDYDNDGFYRAIER